MFKTLAKYIIAVLLAFLAYKVSQAPAVDIVARSLPPPPKHTGVLDRNNKLQSAEIMFKNEIVGPESLAVDGDDGNIYTGLLNGSIVRFHKDDPYSTLKVVVDKLRCSGDPEVTRPLGMRIRDSHLFVVDPAVGVVKINLRDSYATECVLDVEKDFIDNKKAVFLDDLDITKEGVIYISLASRTRTLEESFIECMESGPNAALLKFDMKTREFTTVKSDMYFANGVQLSPDQSYVLVNELTAARITRVWIKGEKAGTSEIFVENLPGIPDNIRPRKDGGYWVAMGLSRFEGNSAFDELLNKPWLRYIVAKFVPFEIFMGFKNSKKVGQVIAISENGEIIESLQDHGGISIPDVTEANEIDGYLYLGGYFNPFLGKIKL